MDRNNGRRRGQIIDIKPSEILEMQEKVLELQQKSKFISKKLVLILAWYLLMILFLTQLLLTCHFIAFCGC
jgi:hypothetical protein